MSLVRANALSIPLADESVDLIVTSPPYFALRSYTDGGEHYDGQIGSELTPAAFVAALLEVTRECVRVLKPSGSMWVNLGDKYAGSGGGNQSGVLAHRNPAIDAVHDDTQRRDVNGMDSPRRYNQASDGIRAKSLMGLPWRYAIGCIDDLGLILRAEVIWSKPNGLPESVTDRVRRSHETWFHFTREPRYYSAVDEVREPHAPQSIARTTRAYDAGDHFSVGQPNTLNPEQFCNPLGKLPGSVWTVPTEPLRVPDHLPQHFAAFPSEWPRRIILGWSPSGICVACGDGRRPVSTSELDRDRPQTKRAIALAERHGLTAAHLAAIKAAGAGADSNSPSVTAVKPEMVGLIAEAKKALGSYWREFASSGKATITGESCACPTPDAPTRPSRVLDPFAGTGTTVAVANALGRHGIGVDLSADYLQVARWRCQDPKLRAKVLGVTPPAPEVPGQGDLFTWEPDDEPRAA